MLNPEARHTAVSVTAPRKSTPLCKRPMDAKIKDFRIAGLCAATYTAFHDDGSLNFDAIDAQIAELKRGGVTSVFGAPASHVPQLSLPLISRCPPFTGLPGWVCCSMHLLLNRLVWV